MTDETVTPAAGPSASGYPIDPAIEVADKIARWRPIVHWLLAIPHMIILYVLFIVIYILTIISWFAGVITGSVPEGLQKPIVMTQRYSLRVSSYVLFLREEYPPFSFDGSFADPGDYPGVRFDVEPAVSGRSRLTIFFRLLLAIPQYIVLMLLTIALEVVAIIGWFAVIILGRWPGGMGKFVANVLRWNARVAAYIYLLTDEYPPFSFE